MRELRPRSVRYTNTDLEFLVDETAPAAKDREQIKRAIREDKGIRSAVIGDDRVFARVMSDGEGFLNISPRLYFEILLHKAKRELEQASHTLERAGTQTIAVFDVPEVRDLLARPEAIDYLSEMLASFTRVESYSVPVRVSRGTWRRMRFNDADIDSLMRVCESADEDHRLALYKRIADLCLLILGVFPEYAPFDYHYPSGAPRPHFETRVRRGLEEYETEGRRFYRLAGEHPGARALDLAETFQLLHEKLNAAKKPLNFISEHYLAVRKRSMFPARA